MASQKRRKKRYRSPIFFRYLAYILIITTIVSLFIIYRMNVLPLKYYIICAILVGLVSIIIAKVLLSRKKFRRVICSLIAFPLIIGLIITSISANRTIDFLKNNLGVKESYKIQNYQVLVLKSSSYEKIEDINNKKLGIIVSEDEELNMDDVTNTIDKVVSVDYKENEDAISMADSLINKKLDAIVIEESQLAMVIEENGNFENLTKKIYSFEIKIKEENTANSIDITKEPFNVYLSGIDTYGSIKSVSRSDVNIVATVNPKTGKILLTSIPRDYYVKLHGISSYKDKLTHAGMYGVDKSVKTIEDLLNIDINYYVKVNFTSIIKIVDTLGGVSVNNESAFTSKDGYYYKSGVNYLNGEKALSFVRERKAFSDGDHRRGRNQEAFLTALIDKVTTPKIIVKYNSLLKSLDGTFVSNIEDESLTNFIKMQIDKNIDWEVSSISLDGTNGMDYTYSYKSGKLYVMIPDEESIKNAKEQINDIMNPVKDKEKK